MSRGLSGLTVLMTTDTVGGVWTYSLELARALARHGIRTLLATMGGAMSEAQWEEAAAVPRLRVFESRYRLEWMDEPWAEVQAAGRWLRELEHRYRPDIVHLNNYAHGSLEWRRPVLVVAHSCVISWWHGVHGTSPPATYDRYRRVVRAGLLGADCIVAPSEAMRHALQTHYGPLRGTRVIHNGRDPTSFRTRRKQACVFTAGRLWDAAKNVEAVAQAAARLSWPVRVAGEVQHPDHGGSVTFDNVEFLGYLPPTLMRARLAESAVYAFPARYEPFGLSILEAGLSGCALLLGDIPSLRELWDGCALFVPADDTDAIRSALARLTEDAKLRKSLQTRACRRAQNFDIEATAMAYVELYSEVLSSGGTRNAGSTTGLNPALAEGRKK